MGVLLGGFGKLQMGSYYRSLQKRLMNVQSKLRKAQRQTARVQDMISRQEKSINTQITAQQTALQNSTQLQLLSDLGITDISKATTDQLSKFNTLKAQADAQLAQQIAYIKTQEENKIQQMKDIQLEACKDEEDYLGQQKDTLESQIQTVKSDYEACKQMEQQDQQMFKPTYTGGGNG